MHTPLGEYAGSPTPFVGGSPLPHDNYSRIANQSTSPFHITQPLATTQNIIEEEEYQSSKKVNVYSQEQPNKSSVKQLIFNVNSEL